MIDPCIYTDCPFCEFSYIISSEDLNNSEVCYTSGDVIYGCKSNVKE